MVQWRVARDQSAGEQTAVSVWLFLQKFFSCSQALVVWEVLMPMSLLEGQLITIKC